MVLALLLSISLAAEEPTAQPLYLQELKERSDALGLHSHEYWAVLLHLDGRGRSRVDDAAFFLAENGHRDARAELHATLAGLLQAEESVHENGETATILDRFPARAEWLCQQLGIDPQGLPNYPASEVEELITHLGPGARVYLVFPDAYMNTPASMFGHSLLVIRPAQANPLLAQAINYAAETGEDGGIRFAVRGIFGGYPGYYTLMPYYQKVREYTDMDQRDIWEYELNLDDSEVRRLFLHMWELRGIASDYKFFSENCSFNLLYLIDAARPGLNLHRQTRPWVIPLDTIKLVHDADLVEDFHWRPSRLTRTRHMAQQLSRERRRQAIGLAKGSLTATEFAASDDTHADAQVLELASELLQSLRARKKISQGDYQQRLFPILTQRSHIDHDGPAWPERIAEAPPGPELGHGSARVGLRFGQYADKGIVEIEARPAYHDLLDHPHGFVTGSQIEFARLTLRYYDQEKRLRLHNLDIVDLWSLSPIDAIAAPPSWRGRIGMSTLPTGNGLRKEINGEIATGASIVYGPLLMWLMGQADGRTFRAAPHHDIGIGGDTGIIATPYHNWRLRARLQAGTGISGSSSTWWRWSVDQRIQLSKQLQWDTRIERGSRFGEQATVWSSGLLFDF